MNAGKRSVPIESSFEEFFLGAERPIRYALCARFGFESGREATAEAFAYAWEHWERIAVMNNSRGYVYRVGQRLALRGSRTRKVYLSEVAEFDEAPFEPDLLPALSRLSARQRQVVVMVHALGMTHVETGTLLGVSPSTVQRHLERGIRKLRVELGVEDA